MSEELMKRATVSLSATDTFIAVIVLCLSLDENILITLSKEVFMIITIKAQETEMNYDVALATVSYSSFLAASLNFLSSDFYQLLMILMISKQSPTRTEVEKYERKLLKNLLQVPIYKFSHWMSDGSGALVHSQ
jgi:large-conductance mechanosensitive channel